MSEKIHLPDPSHDRKLKIAVVIAVIVFMGSTAWNVATKINVQKSNSASIGQVIRDIELACINRHALTVQYQVRAKNQRLLAETQLLTTQAFLIALAESPPPPPDTTQEELEIRAAFIHRYKAAVPKLEHILHTTKILPLEDCHKQAEELRQNQPPG